MNKSPSAEIIAIGTELLLGEIVDSNSAHIAGRMRELGIDVFRTTTVGDNRARIQDAIQAARQRADIVLTTGGLGPTADDVTREAFADALGADLEFRDELWTSIQARFASSGLKPTANNRRQAHLPAGSRPLPNPVGTAPGFLIEQDGRLLAALPGVPGEMQQMLADHILPILKERLGGGAVIESLLLRSAGVGESWIDEKISDLEQGSNPTVGLAAHAGRVDIRITSKARTVELATKMNNEMAEVILSRIGEHIYAQGSQSLESVLRDRMQEIDGRVLTVECGTGAVLARALSVLGPVFRRGTVLPQGTGWEELREAANGPETQPQDLQIVCQLESPSEEVTLRAELTHRGEKRELRRTFRGQLAEPARWAASLVLDSAWRLIRPPADGPPRSA